MSRFERTYSRDLLSSFHRSRTLGIKRLWVAQLVRPPGASRDRSSMMWGDIWAQGTETAAGEALLIQPGKYKCPIWLKLDTTFIFHSWPAPTLNGLLHLKMRESYQSIPKEIHPFLKERGTISVFEVAFEAHPSGTSPNYEAFVLLA